MSKNSSKNSKLLAQLLYTEADKQGLKGNRWVPECKYWEANYKILHDSNCPAVLTENMFQDNKDDVKFLLSKEGNFFSYSLEWNLEVNKVNSLVLSLT